MNDVIHKRLGIAEEHQRLGEIIERIVDAGEARTDAALDDHDRTRFVDILDGHAINGAGGIGARRGIGHVIGADHQPRRVFQLSIGFANVQGGSGMSRRSERVLRYGSYICPLLSTIFVATSA